MLAQGKIKHGSSLNVDIATLSVNEVECSSSNNIVIVCIVSILYYITGAVSLVQPFVTIIRFETNI